MNWKALFKGPKEKFKDGSSIRPISRDEYQYIEASGRSMTLYAGLTGRGPIEREIPRSAFEQWTNPVSEDVPPQKQIEICEKLKIYFDRRGTTYSFH